VKKATFGSPFLIGREPELQRRLHVPVESAAMLDRPWVEETDEVCKKQGAVGSGSVAGCR
jgi:hypothetical protein